MFFEIIAEDSEGSKQTILRDIKQKWVAEKWLDYLRGKYGMVGHFSIREVIW